MSGRTLRSVLFLLAYEQLYCIYALVAFLFAGDAARTSDPQRRISLSTMAVAFGLLVAFAAVRITLAAGLVIADRLVPFFPRPVDVAAETWFFFGLNLPLPILVGFVAYRLRMYPRALWAMGIAALAGAVPNILWFWVPDVIDRLDIVLDGIWVGGFILLTTYALIRHQLLDLDRKVRWGLSRTTLAAVFLAAFFVGSEAAQELFTGFAGSQYVGIAGAGLLVFALAPLQRAADRLAAHAVPPVPTRPEGREIYRSALRVALVDGGISRSEERELAVLGQQMGLDPLEVLELRDEVEASLRMESARTQRPSQGIRPTDGRPSPDPLPDL